MLDTASITKDKIQEKELLETKKVLLQIKSNKNFKIRWELGCRKEKVESLQQSAVKITPDFLKGELHG